MSSESMNDLKGLISVDAENTISLTCCESRPRVQIDKIDVYNALRESSGLVGPDSEEDPPEKPSEGPTEITWRVRYVIRDTPWSPQEDFDTAVADVIEHSLNSEHVRGCYSEMTCGVGDYDFALNNGHSLLTELANYEGQYVWIKFV